MLTTMQRLRPSTSATAPDGTFGDPPATMRTHAAALEDVLAGFETLGARDEVPRLFVEMPHRGIAEGLDDNALKAVIDVLAGDC